MQVKPNPSHRSHSRTFRSALSLLLPATCFVLASMPLAAGSSSPKQTQAPAEVADEINLLTGEGVSLGGVLFPHLHVTTAFGASTADEISSLASSHHDPQDTFTVQALEPALSLRLGDFIQGFAVSSAYTDADGDFDGEVEEAFGKIVNIPGGFEIRGGRFMNRFGFTNATHNHAWDFVNINLANDRFLQEGHLTTDGVEVTWNVPTTNPSALSLSFGNALSHEHDHGHAEHAEESTFEGEGSAFNETILGANYIYNYNYNDFHQTRLVLSAALGDNTYGRTTQIYGAGFEYLWRENGFEPGG